MVRTPEQAVLSSIVKSNNLHPDFFAAPPRPVRGAAFWGVGLGEDIFHIVSIVQYIVQ